ncbi:MAG: hypothetical protein II722_09410 [Ruminococcus sp.]|nr:hypothetical protein [Ruminococcus sp.]
MKRCIAAALVCAVLLCGCGGSGSRADSCSQGENASSAAENLAAESSSAEERSEAESSAAESSAAADTAADNSQEDSSREALELPMYPI